MKDPPWLSKEMEQRREQDSVRTLKTLPGTGGILHMAGRRILNFASNDYLDLCNHQRVIEGAAQAVRTFGAGATASRLVAGNLNVHEALEIALAAHKGYPAALVFGSGYMANLGVVTACIGSDDVAFVDRLIHASVLDAVRLSGARLIRFHHNDTNHLQHQLKKHGTKNRKLVVTESLFSMDGDLAPLAELAEIASRFHAVFLVDEAHATGVFGPAGAGRVAELKLQEQTSLCMGTLSKGLGNYGGFVACSERWRDIFVQLSRSFIYTTALPPSSICGSLAALQVLEGEPNRGEKLLEKADFFRKKLQDCGLNTSNSASQLIPIVLGDNHVTVTVAEKLYEEGILAVAIRPPTVPRGTSRLRLSVTMAHSKDDLAYAATTISRIIHEMPIPL